MTESSPSLRSRPAGPSAPRRPARRRALAASMLFAIALTAACATLEVMPVETESESGATPLAAHVAFGAFTYGGVWRGMEPVVLLEAELGRQLDVVHWFMNWDHTYDPRMAAAVTAGGRAPLISWQPMRQDVRDIADGRYDDVLRSWAQGVRAAQPDLVYLRPFPEMNGEWVPWNGDPEALRMAWIRMTEVFAAEGADNVRWVWSPNVTDQPRTEANRMEHYYPGDAYVDVFGLSGYNWGETRPSIGWRSFETVFATGYARITALGPHPLWLTELASSDEGGDKAAWVRDMFASTAFPRITALIWFDEHKEADWRLRSAPEVVLAFQTSLGVAPTAAGRY
jgi:hypothetical protein